VKPPPQPRNGGKRSPKAARKELTAQYEEVDPDDADDNLGGEVQRFEIPIPGKRSVRVTVPSDLDADDWTMLQSMITVYINRWKGFKPEPQK
jgi:hypothetical protein